ncbi:hypothetical protein JCM33374_g4600 [Metschnikowia sp. JCM 33374]|nr:hypothetical protein JCM33374_g4600 [Metschnikowia sp. JCM 33374]
MPPKHLQSQKRPRTHHETNHGLAGTDVPVGIPATFPEHLQQLNPSTGVSYTPELYPPVYPHAHVLRRCYTPQTQPITVERELIPMAEGITNGTTYFSQNPEDMMDMPALGMSDSLQNPSIANPLHQYDMEESSSPLTPIPGVSKVLLSKNTIELQAAKQKKLDTAIQTIPCQNPGKAPSKTIALPGLECPTDATTQSKSSERAEDAFRRLLPLLRTVHTHHFGEFLLEVLKECHDHVSLDEFFCILYESDSVKDTDTFRKTSNQIHQCPSHKRQKEARLISLVVESFKSPRTFENGLLRDSLLSTVNLHELLRNFFAMKIIFSCITKVEDPSKSIPRICLYKVYYILCQDAIQKYPELSKPLCLEQNLILGLSKIGILAKVVHPHLECKRLGKRGQSKAHYINVVWNDAMVDDHIIRLLDLDIADLREHYSKSNKAEGGTAKSIPRQPQGRPPIDKIAIKPKPFLPPAQPSYSFVNFRSRYPAVDCSPRVWKATSNSIPEHSEWAKDVMQRSMRVLKSHGVNLEPLLANTSKGVFSGNDHSSISSTVIQSIKVLSGHSSCQESVLHLVLVIILLIFPVTLASDQEVSSVCKSQFRSAVKDCVTKLETEVETLSYIGKGSMKTFSVLLRKMIHISEMASTSAKLCPTESVLKGMIADVRLLTDRVGDNIRFRAFEEIFIKGFIKAINAYQYDLAEEKTPDRQSVNLATINSIGVCFREVSGMVLHKMSQILSCIEKGDVAICVPHEVFHLSVELVHKVALLHPVIAQLPMPVFTSMMLQHTRVLQNASFVSFSHRGRQLSQEIFKSWWVYSSMFQEYLSVLSERCTGCSESEGVSALFPPLYVYLFFSIICIYHSAGYPHGLVFLHGMSTGKLHLVNQLLGTSFDFAQRQAIRPSEDSSDILKNDSRHMTN